MAQKLATAGAAAMIAMGSLGAPAIAGEFDILSEPTPTNYFVDDANVLSKSTRGDLNKRLKLLEVGLCSWMSQGTPGSPPRLRRGCAPSSWCARRSSISPLLSFPGLLATCATVQKLLRYRELQ